jgi:dihydroorotase
MGKILFKDFRVFDGRCFIEADHVLVENGVISEIGKDIACGDAEVVEGSKEKILSPGFIDLHAHMRDPGEEWNEDICSGARAGAAGGFTTIVAMPNTKPAISDASLVGYVAAKGSSSGGARILPAGCVSKNREGKEMAELLKMAEAGAVLFTDDGSPVAATMLLRLALLYLGKRQPRIMEHPEDTSLFKGGQVHEGRVSALSGLKGIPAASEEIDVARGISLVRDTGGRIHFTHISCKGALALIREAKKEGLDVTCDTTFHHLTLNENAVINSGYNSRYKVNPPLRSPEDQAALWEGLQDGTIDAIVTDHAPWHMDEKDEPFQEAPFGIASLECAAAVVIDFKNRNYPEIPLELLLSKMTSSPASILPEKWNGLGVIKEGAAADITVLDLERTRIVDCFAWRSKARCCPWEGIALTGWPIMTFLDGRKIWQDDEDI